MIHLANDFSTQHEQGVHSMGKWGGAESVNGSVRGATEQGDQI